jgi:ABC-type lipoprotein export system ATPase subunit
MILQLKGLFKWVNSGGNRVFLLNDIDFTVNEGEFISIMGPSGSGKTTLLNVIGMLDDFNEGEYTFLEESVHNLKEKHRSKLYKEYIGFVFQSYHLIDELTVYENIETPLLYKNYKSSERKAMVADMLDRFNIVGKKDLFPPQLSGGQQQLIGIARALVSSPKLILADEPTGNLNSQLTLEQCITIALENNLDAKNADLRKETAKINYKQSVNQILPNLNANYNLGANKGRSIDPFTNSYSNREFTYSNLGVNLRLTVFNGFRLLNAIKQDELNLKAVEMEKEETKQNLRCYS